MLLEIKNLSAAANGKKIIKGLSLSLAPGSTTILMGRNGSGKSTLANAILKNPKYEIEGKAKFDGRDMGAMTTDEIARAGIFLSPQQSPAIPGLSISTLLKHSASAASARPLPAPEFFALAKEYCAVLDIPSAWLSRDVGTGFSGGEKKRLSMLEMLFANPKLAILDEPDSGVDVSSIDLVARAIEYQKKKGAAFLIVSHYPKLIDAARPDSVVVMKDGAIVKTGGAQLAKDIEQNGFDSI